MKVLILFATLSLINFNQAFKIVPNPRHHEDGDITAMKIYFSTQIVQETRTVMSTITETDFSTCYATESGIAGCQKKRDLGDDDGNDVEESLVERVPKVELNGEHVSWESLISPSRVIREVEGEGEVVEEVYPSPVQVVQPDQGEPASVVYASSIVESRNEENDAEIEPSENTIDNSDSHVDDVTDDQDVTTESVEFYTYRNVDNVDSNTEYEGEETTLVPEVVVEADAARENPIVEGTLEENWELTDVRVKMPGRSNQSGDKCLEDAADQGLFFTILSTMYVTITEYATSTVPGSNTVLFKSSGGCLPSDVQELFTASCNL